MREIFENWILPIVMGLIGCGIGLLIARAAGLL